MIDDTGRRRQGMTGRLRAGAWSQRADVLRLRALGALGGLELDLLVLVEGAVPGRRDGRVVHEDVGAAVLGSDEAEALLSVEPLHGACCHYCYSSWSDRS